ncbi:hypothetical protein BCIN_04g02690 [Botrytis cinerea B05.10]|uniref:Uncharacterized protein n=3 Tax=Botryotinia fuckeliana TaxID=40559 RepID=A0A384JEN7_BOTFB|nr:hypothetical protein BCIN_04g02690 [Botrytis cinerea B05.10]ATZ49075.1 hypothetical protein BCIN_04g02690 [Botrytis cinerea B05.10]
MALLIHYPSRLIHLILIFTTPQSAEWPRLSPTPHFFDRPILFKIISKLRSVFSHGTNPASQIHCKSPPVSPNLPTGSGNISNFPVPTSLDLKSSYTTRSYYLRKMSSLNPRAPVFIPSLHFTSSTPSAGPLSSFTPRPLPPIPHHLAAANAAGYSFIAAYPNHPLAEFAAEEVQTAVDERALVLCQKDKLREKMLVSHLKRFLHDTGTGKEAVKGKKWVKSQEKGVVSEYKKICAKLGERPEVSRWFF